MSEDVLDLSFIDTMLADAEKITSKNGGNGDLKVVYLTEKNIPKRSFTMRIVLDSNNQLCNQFRVYSVPIKTVIKDESGEEKEVEKRIAYRAPLSWDEDIVKPYADQLNHYLYDANYNISFFGEIVDVTEGASEKFPAKTPCILVTSGKKFLIALTAAMKNVTAKTKKDDSNFGKKLLAQSLDPTKTGYLINVTAIKSTQWSFNVSFDLFGDPEHEINPEIAKQFDDITKAYCPSFGPENDANGLKVIEQYKKLIAERSDYVEPDPVEESKPKIDVKDIVESKEEKPKTEVKEPTKDNGIEDLDAALDAAGVPE